MSVSGTVAPTERVLALLRERGALPFAQVMEEALYGEGGYYNRPDMPIGPRGDFVTGSSLSRLFGRATARLLERLDEVLGGAASLLDVGCGNGRHLAAIAEASPGRRLLGLDRVERSLPPGVTPVGSLEAVPPIDGVVFSYELFDALPVHRLVGREDGTVGELWVGLDEEGVAQWRIGELSAPELIELLGENRLGAGQIADLAPGWGPLYGRLAGVLRRGLLVTFDYGYERSGLLDARIRRHGTLACYRQHHVHRDALRDLGEQDLTAHIDFTTLREVGESRGLETVSFSRQALWLTGLGIFEDLEGEPDLATRQEAAALLDPEGMGDQIRVLVQSRGVDTSGLLGGSEGVFA